jgi:tetratricopeptide (TPR) repeat protein
MAKKRVSRKKLLKEPDEFITTTGRIIAWSRNNTRPLIIGGAGFFAVIVLVALFSYYQEYRGRNAATLLGASVAKYQAELAAGSAEKALDAVREDFKRLIDGYGGQPSGRLGRVIFAHYCLAGGSTDDAAVHYKRALDDFRGDASLTNIILNGLGEAMQKSGDDAAAATYYKQLADSGSPVLKDAALFNLGMLYGRLGKTDEGQKAFDRLAADFPERP